ncbi:ABC transporter ATP-binding protein [Tetragenococcus halophilus]|uniref:ABC transporter ATP-binding protein n=1 Tax=Tetragenococcus halophilus TaxID=51669 RepID=UPI001F167A24|nr:ABC transporter ATP-binding protein [Tetragenococcus halophilus]MCF1601450.1 ABC transporter ATP-binding protein [Tetragenococcus halophilus]MCO8289315.1 ABC transporter ATP-binding protein [Tetragenococcus halophilus]MCO8296331.1 ABC transporter ATP-binding protein [Tetragenococcus halophilus]
MGYIDLENLTKDYGQDSGVFDISLSIEQGETFGLVGINGAGKTTTIRQLMGFIKPDSGQAFINGMDTQKSSAQIKRFVSYVPGEINFPADKTGETFLKRQMEKAGRGSWERCKEICERLQLDYTAGLKTMSKGMKQKTALAAAFSLDSDVLILDEPSTGLDPLMRDVFIDLIKEEKEMGHTIFLSSHIFEEIEQTCDRVAMIKDGRIIDQLVMKDLLHNKNKTYKLEFKTKESFQQFQALGYELSNVKEEDLQLNVNINDKDINDLMNDLQYYDVLFFKEIKTNFEDYFTNVFKEEVANV